MLRFKRQRNEIETCVFLFIHSLLLYIYGGHAEGHDSLTGRNAWRLAMPAVAGVAVPRRVK
jgi:hypothetical protein